MTPQPKTQTDVALFRGKRLAFIDDHNQTNQDPEIFLRFRAGDTAKTTKASAFKGKRIVIMYEPTGPLQDPEIFQKYTEGGYLAALDTATAEAYSRLPEDVESHAAYDKLFKKFLRMSRTQRMAARHSEPAFTPSDFLLKITAKATEVAQLKEKRPMVVIDPEPTDPPKPTLRFARPPCACGCTPVLRFPSCKRSRKRKR